MQLTAATMQARSTIPIPSALPAQGRISRSAMRKEVSIPFSLAYMYATPAHSAIPMVSTGSPSSIIRIDAHITVLGSFQSCLPKRLSAYM